MADPTASNNFLDSVVLGRSYAKAPVIMTNANETITWDGLDRVLLDDTLGAARAKSITVAGIPAGRVTRFLIMTQAFDVQFPQLGPAGGFLAVVVANSAPVNFGVRRGEDGNAQVIP